MLIVLFERPTRITGIITWSRQVARTLTLVSGVLYCTCVLSSLIWDKKNTEFSGKKYQDWGRL